MSKGGDTPASFRYKMGELRRIATLLYEEHGVKEPVHLANRKLGGRAFAERLGVRSPAFIAGPVTIDDLELAQLPDRFVVKPLLGTASRGVFPLHRMGPDAYRSLLDGNQVMCAKDILGRFRSWIDKGAVSSQVMVEELVHEGSSDHPVLPIDWRFFCFYGEVGFVMAREPGGQRDGSNFTFRFFDERWVDLGVVRDDVVYDLEIPAPRHADAMIEAAKTLSAAIPRPMIRIDLYDGTDGPYFGEVSPFPGGTFDLPAAYDREFGEQWERAAARLEREAIDAGIRVLRDRP